ncbi:hypothetical protein GMD78_13495 [Ornithinibacillus sp. L9]|uniref:Permuted papain-like amidase enzyme, YaeF/YiiX, C92 family n=1 Tax=Ornithinibacillus caprae TaxID=2678566 RepID=A0A6N8FMX3_9BACI|nr:hypothetical protein [Ornithinibacillus caprae]MUK89377.1 hypothetical protein [Ornithinibacillus caprae]
MNDERKIYLLLTDTGTLFTKIIKLFTNAPYNHASISFDHDLFDVYSFGRKRKRNPFIGGFVREDVRSSLFKHADCVVYSHSITEIQYQKMKRYIQEIDEQQDLYRYNFLGLFGFLFRKPINRTNALFCSQFVASVLAEGGILDIEKPLPLVAPYDLKENGNFQLIYQGKLAHLINHQETKSKPNLFLQIKKFALIFQYFSQY